MLASVEAMAGQAILGGIIDEVNFMARVDNSVRVPGPRTELSARDVFALESNDNDDPAVWGFDDAEE